MAMLTETEARRAGIQIIRDSLGAHGTEGSISGAQAANLWASVKLLRLYLTNGLVTDPIFGDSAARARAEQTIRHLVDQAVVAESMHKAIVAARKRGKNEAA